MRLKQNKNITFYNVDLIDKIKVYINNGKRAAKELNDDRNVKHIRSDIKTCLEYGEEKVALALQTYELVCIFIYQTLIYYLIILIF